MAGGNDRILTTHAGSLPRPDEVADLDLGTARLHPVSLVDPGVAWLKLKSLSEGAELASAEL